MGLIENIEGFYNTIDAIIDEGAGLTLDAEGKRPHFVSFIQALTKRKFEGPEPDPSGQKFRVKFGEPGSFGWDSSEKGVVQLKDFLVYEE